MRSKSVGLSADKPPVSQIEAVPDRQINAQQPAGHCAFIFTLLQEFSLFFFAFPQTMLFQFVQQRAAADVERLGATHPVAAMFLQCPDDDFPLQAMRHLAQGAGIVIT